MSTVISANCIKELCKSFCAVIIMAISDDYLRKNTIPRFCCRTHTVGDAVQQNDGKQRHDKPRAARSIRTAEATARENRHRPIFGRCRLRRRLHVKIGTVRYSGDADLGSLGDGAIRRCRQPSERSVIIILSFSPALPLIGLRFSRSARPERSERPTAPTSLSPLPQDARVRRRA